MSRSGSNYRNRDGAPNRDRHKREVRTSRSDTPNFEQHDDVVSLYRQWQQGASHDRVHEQPRISPMARR